MAFGDPLLVVSAVLVVGGLALLIGLIFWLGARIAYLFAAAALMLGAYLLGRALGIGP
jgi:hypothetical protein